MFGPDLLVLPVLDAGARSRRVYLPAGTTWTDAWTDEVSGWRSVDHGGRARWTAFRSTCGGRELPISKG